MLNEQTMAPKGLGASDDEDDIDNTAKWVQRSRKKQLVLHSHQKLKG